MTYASIHFQLCFIELDRVGKQAKKQETSKNYLIELYLRIPATGPRFGSFEGEGFSFLIFFFSFFFFSFCIYRALYVFVLSLCGLCLFYSTLLFLFLFFFFLSFFLFFFIMSPLLYFFYYYYPGLRPLSIVHYAMWPIHFYTMLGGLSLLLHVTDVLSFQRT